MRFLDVHRHGLARAERRGAAHQVAAVAIGHFRLARLDRLGADLARQVLGRDLAVAVHQHHQRPRLLVFHDQRLDHGERIEPQHLRAVLRAAVLQVLVGMLGERHPFAFRKAVAGVSLTCSFLAMPRTQIAGIADFPADLVDLRQQFGRQLRAPGVEVLVELRHRRHADDGAGHLPFGVAPGQRHPGGRQAVVAGQLRCSGARRPAPRGGPSAACAPIS